MRASLNNINVFKRGALVLFASMTISLGASAMQSQGQPQQSAQCKGLKTKKAPKLEKNVQQLDCEQQTGQFADQSSQGFVANCNPPVTNTTTIVEVVRETDLSSSTSSDNGGCHNNHSHHHTDGGCH